jgi:hypothetical protein
VVAFLASLFLPHVELRQHSAMTQRHADNAAAAADAPDKADTETAPPAHP